MEEDDILDIGDLGFDEEDKNAQNQTKDENPENQKYIKPSNQINKKPKEKKRHNNITKKLNLNDNNFKNVKNNNYVNSEEDKDSIEFKLTEKIKQLYICNNIKEKLSIFQYLFNSFNEILKGVDNISALTLRQFVDIHIEYIIFEDKSLTEQIINSSVRTIMIHSELSALYCLKLPKTWSLPDSYAVP